MTTSPDASVTIARDTVEKLIWDIKVTAGSRFNAASRLERKEKRASILASTCSALLICVSIATFALPLGSSIIRYASFGGIAASVLLLVLSMKSFGDQSGIASEQMHRCALELNELKRIIQARNEILPNEHLTEYIEKYNNRLQKWSLNHSSVDFLKYKYSHKWEFEDIANIPDSDLPEHKFQEINDASAAGISIATLIAAAFTVFVAYMLWGSVGN